MWNTKIRNWTKIFLLATTLPFLLTCNRIELKYKCCNNEYEVVSGDYNKDGVAIYIPNMFTPNNDGINDYFSPVANGWDSFYMKIKNGRKIIFETEDLDKKWDGKNKKDKMVRPGQYSYEIEITTIHSETVKIEGKVCMATFEKDYEKRWLDDFCDCIFGDMIDQRNGIVYSSEENCK